MPRNIMQALNNVPDGRQPKTGFDLMSFETFTQKGGMLNVVGVRDTVPNSDYRMAVDAFTRSLPCNTANFAHIKENYYFVHVPLGLISRNAYQTLVQRKQPYSALDMGVSQFPVFDLYTVLCRCLDISHFNLDAPQYAKFRDVHGFNIGRQAFRLFDMLGYGCYLDIVESTFKSSDALTIQEAKRLFEGVRGYKPTANRLAAYQMVWYYFFRNDIYDNDVTPRSFNFDDVTYKSDSNEPSYNILDVRSVDDFIVECCQLRYVGYKKDLFMGSMPGTQYGAVSTVNVKVEFDDLSASFVGDSLTPTGSFQGNQVNPTGTFNGNTIDLNGKNQSGVFNFHTGSFSREKPSDDIYVDGGVNAVQKLGNENTTAGTVWKGALTSNEENVRTTRGDGDLSDTTYLYTPGPNNVRSELRHSHSGNLSDHWHALVGTVTPSGSINLNSFTPTGSISLDSITPSGTVNLSGPTTNYSLFDVLQLVQAQAIQKWRQKSMLAGNKTADQFRAHHGEVPRHLIDHLPDFIGSVDNEIQITEITSQADTAVNDDESNLGEIAGRGYGASNARYFNFHSDDYGILILLHAIVPENTYSSYGLDFGNTMIYYNDFYQSEYTNLGLQAVPKFLLNSVDSSRVSVPSGTGTDTFSTDTGIIGYAPRYFSYKQYPSRVHGMFNPSRLLIKSPESSSIFGYNDMQSFAITRKDLALFMTGGAGYETFSSLTLSLSNLYVHPSIFDSIFAVDADDSEVTDEFITHAKFICDASLPMPVIGLPQF